MYFSDRAPMDVPPPPTVDELAARFDVALMALVPQPSLSEMGGGMIGSSSNGGPTVLEEVSISYTVWRVPNDRDDPANLADLNDSVREALSLRPSRPLPDWMIELRRLSRFPSLWEAVTTTPRGGPRVADARVNPAAPRQPHPEQQLPRAARRRGVPGRTPVPRG